MQIYVINLDHKLGRWQHMAGLLQGLPFKRLAAVDGKTIDGLEENDRSLPRSPAKLSRYHRACVLSHRAAWREFLAGADRHCCVLEDDLFISPDFPRFINNAAWIPPDCDVVKIETAGQEVLFTGKSIACLDRRGMRLGSLHLGTGAYIVSRRAAQILLELTVEPDRAVDRIMFEPDGLQRLCPVYQLIPALCIQAIHRKDGMIFPDMESSIRSQISPPTAPPQKGVLAKVKRELARPFHQLNDAAQSAGLRLKGLRRASVPFA